MSAKGGPYLLGDLDRGVQIYWGVQIRCDTGADRVTAGTLQLQPGFPMKVSIQCHLSDTRIIFQQGLRTWL
jgi:hypothetical protein